MTICRGYPLGGVRQALRFVRAIATHTLEETYTTKFSAYWSIDSLKDEDLLAGLRDAFELLPEETRPVVAMGRYRDEMEDAEVLELFREFIGHPGIQQATLLFHGVDVTEAEPTLEMVPTLRELIPGILMNAVKDARKCSEAERDSKGVTKVRDLLSKPRYSWLQASIDDEIQVTRIDGTVQSGRLSSKSTSVMHGVPGEDTAVVSTWRIS